VFQLQQAISFFVHKGHRVLVFGRQHMKSWDVYKQHESAHVGWFFTQNVSVLHIFVVLFQILRIQKLLYADALMVVCENELHEKVVK